MLNGGSLDGNTLTVASSTGAKPGLAGEKVAVVTDHQEGEEVEQEGSLFVHRGGKSADEVYGDR